MRKFLIFTMLAFAAWSLAPNAKAQSRSGEDAVDAVGNSAQFARQLSSSDPLTRQAAAEALARLAAVDQKKLVEGYVLEEKDKRVKLALSWALYRMGKSMMLFSVVRDLDSARHDQAADYLAQLESPEPLYTFLRQENMTPKVTARLLEVLGRVGDGETLVQIKPLAGSFDPKVAEAAQSAANMIQHRLDQPQEPVQTRPRITGQKPNR
jgi:HEAT repeat protein